MSEITDCTDRLFPYSDSIFKLASDGGHTIRLLKLAEVISSGLVLATGPGGKWTTVTLGLKTWRTLQTAWVRVPKAFYFLSQPKKDEFTTSLEQFATTISPLFFGAFAFLSLLKLAGKHKLISGVDGLGNVGLYGGLFLGSAVAAGGTALIARGVGARARFVEEKAVNQIDSEEKKKLIDEAVNLTLEYNDNIRGATKYFTEWFVDGIVKTLLLPRIAARFGAVARHQAGIGWGLRAIAYCPGTYQSVRKVWAARPENKAPLKKKMHELTVPLPGETPGTSIRWGIWAKKSFESARGPMTRD